LIIFGGSLILGEGSEPEMLMARRRLLALAILLVLPLAAHAQERKPEPEASKVLLDTERVRVTEVRVKPGAKFELKGHPYQFVYMLTDGSLVFSPPGKQPFELMLRAGEVSLLPSQSTATENDSEKEVRAVVVEIKESSRVATKASTGKSKARAVRSRAKPKTRAPAAPRPQATPRRSG
jgi:quercetin dioxygenase-like cupin family protein